MSVATGFPKHRNVFLRKVLDKSNGDEDEYGDDERVLDENKKEIAYVQIEGSNNRYVKPPSIHDKYASRPDCIEHICLTKICIYNPIYNSIFKFV